MEKIRIAERKILRKTNNIKRKRNSFKHIPNRKIYKCSNISRIDKYMIDLNIKFFNRCLDNKNQFIMDLIQPYTESKYKYPSYIFHLNENNDVIKNGECLLFHRGYFNENILVYNRNL